MNDRHSSLIHSLLSGVIGLLLGLFIGWWVWPVQWTDAPAASARPAASAPVQAEETPIEGGAESASNYAAFLDWVNQGLLILAAALLLVGGVVIGYQLLRQSKDSEPAARSTTRMNAKDSSRQAAVPRGRRAFSAIFAGRLVGRQTPILGWLLRARPLYGGADIDEPVFPAQSATRRAPADQPAHARQIESGAVRPQDRGAEPSRSSAHIDDMQTIESVPVSKPDWAYTPPEPLSADESEPDTPFVTGMAEAAQSEMRESLTTQEGERLESWQEEDRYGEGPVADEGSDGKNGESSPDIAPVVTEDFPFNRDENEEDAAPWEDSWQPPSTGTGTLGVQVDAEVESGGHVQDFQPSDAATWVDQPTQRIDEEIDPGPPVPIESKVDASQSSQIDQASTAQTSREPTGAFKANYAFDIQSYDESFTINSADGALLGACGMGINESLDRAAADSGQVRLLEIWLYDRSAVRSVSQSLVSPGFDLTGLNNRAQEGGSEISAPMELSPGLTYTLSSNHITLDCTIKSVTFLESEQTPRPFRSVSASLIVHSLT